MIFAFEKNKAKTDTEEAANTYTVFTKLDNVVWHKACKLCKGLCYFFVIYVFLLRNRWK